MRPGCLVMSERWRGRRRGRAARWRVGPVRWRRSRVDRARGRGSRLRPRRRRRCRGGRVRLGPPTWFGGRFRPRGSGNTRVRGRMPGGLRPIPGGTGAGRCPRVRRGPRGGRVMRRGRRCGGRWPGVTVRVPWLTWISVPRRAPHLRGVPTARRPLAWPGMRRPLAPLGIRTDLTTRRRPTRRSRTAMRAHGVRVPRMSHVRRCVPLGMRHGRPGRRLRPRESRRRDGRPGPRPVRPETEAVSSAPVPGSGPVMCGSCSRVPSSCLPR